MKPVDSNITGLYTRSVACWIKTNSTSNYQYLMSIGNRGSANVWGISLEAGTGFTYAYDSTNQASYSTTNPVADGQWHFICVNDTGNNKTIYVDGRLIHTVATSPHTISSDCNYYVGAFGGSSSLSYVFLGSLALQRFSHTMPSAEQINKNVQ